MPAIPAIAVEGPKGVGKTATARRRANTVITLDKPAERDLLIADPTWIGRAPQPLLIDEWQHYPPAWDAVRHFVDDDPRPGRFLIAGSATPADGPTHTGAGRIVSLRLRPMSLAERCPGEQAVSLHGLLAGSRPPIDAETSRGLPFYADEITRSGFPGIRQLSERGRRAQLDGYLTQIVRREFTEQGRPVRKPATLMAWLRAYAAATSTTASYAAIASAATPGDAEKPAKTTTAAYRDVLTQLWLLDPVPGWLPTGSPLRRLAQAPKHHLADPSLAARLLGADAAALLGGVPAPAPAPRPSSLAGYLFESLVTLGVLAYAQAAEASVHHLRTRNGDHEVDLIVQRQDQRVVAIEVKFSATVSNSDVAHLAWLRDRLGDALLDALVVTTGSHAYRRQDGIGVVPAVLLGP